ncbi:MAG: ABC transporter ATP-binding protein [Lysobacterales bacterium]
MKTRNLGKTFGKLKAVQALDLDVPRSKIYGFLGPNGSGKSTTIRMLCGLLTPTTGEITVLGLSIPDQAESLRLKVGYMTQKFSLFEDLTVFENLQFMADIYTMPYRRQRQRIGRALERYELTSLVKQRAATLSGGQKQRLALAAATLHDPELLFLDEPTSAVDPENRRSFWESLFDLVAEGTTILVSTHYMDEAERCHSLAILDRGVLVAQGSPAELETRIDASIVIVEATHPRQVGKLLEGLPFVQSTAQIGNQLRVMVNSDQAEPERAIRAAVEKGGLGLEKCDVTGAGLEDVFVAATRSRRNAA